MALSESLVRATGCMEMPLVLVDPDIFEKGLHRTRGANLEGNSHCIRVMCLGVGVERHLLPIVSTVLCTVPLFGCYVLQNHGVVRSQRHHEIGSSAIIPVLISLDLVKRAFWHFWHGPPDLRQLKGKTKKKKTFQKSRNQTLNKSPPPPRNPH